MSKSTKDLAAVPYAAFPAEYMAFARNNRQCNKDIKSGVKARTKSRMSEYDDLTTVVP
jgi:hypothetical protein